MPLEVAAKAARVAELALTIAQHGNPNAITDAGSAASLAQSAVECAGRNELINASGRKADPEAGRLRAEVERLTAAVKASADAVRAEVAKAID